MFRTLERASYDARLRAEAKIRPVSQDPRILMLCIDDRSFERIGPWPWPRQLWASLVDSLSELGATAAFFDVTFPEPARSRTKDEFGSRSLDEALKGTFQFLRENFDDAGLAQLVQRRSGAATPVSTDVMREVAAVVRQGVDGIQETVREFAASPDAVFGESVALARVRGMPVTGLFTLHAARGTGEPAPAGRDLERELAALIERDPFLDMEAIADPAVRSYAREHGARVTTKVIEQAAAAEVAKLGAEADTLDADALAARPALKKYAELGRHAITIFDHALVKRSLQRHAKVDLSGADRLPRLPRATALIPASNSIAREMSWMGADNTPKDDDGAVRRMPLVWQLDGATYPCAALGILLALTHKGDGLPQLAVQDGPAIALPVPGAGTVAVPVSDSGRMPIHWAGGFDDTFAKVRIDRVLLHAEQKRAKEEYFLKRLPGLQYRQTRLYRAQARTLSVREPAKELALTDLTALVKARWPSTSVNEAEYLTGKVKLESAAVAKRPADWVAHFDAVLAAMEQSTFAADAFFLKKAAGYKDPEKRKAAEAKLAVQIEGMRLYKDGLAAMEADLKKLVGGKICFVGHTAQSTTDLMATPFSAAYPGIGAHANLINTIFGGRFVTRPAGLGWSLGGAVDTSTLQLPLVIVVAFAFAWLLPTLSSVAGAALALLFVLAWVALSSALLIWTGMWVDMVAPVLTAGFAYVGVFTWRSRSTEWVRSMFESYVDPRIVAVLMENKELWQELGGREQQITAFFSDIAGFTTLSELLSPHELSEMLTDYLSPMTDCILAHDGTRDKYIGDAIVAFFGAPLPAPGHALSACLSSIKQQEMLIELKKQWIRDKRSWYLKLQERGHDLTFRIGLNTGPAKVGNFGSMKSKNYTMIGDTVNLASRLEGANKEYGSLIMISETTLTGAGDKIVARPLDRLVVKGKLEAVKVFEVIGRKGEVDRIWDDVLPLYDEALALYYARKFTEARAKLEKVLAIKPGDGAAEVYVERCDGYLKEPPPEDWDGRFIMLHK